METAPALAMDGTPVIGLSGRERRLDKVLTTLLQATAQVFLGHIGDVVLLDPTHPSGAKHDKYMTSPTPGCCPSRLVANRGQRPGRAPHRHPRPTAERGIPQPEDHSRQGHATNTRAIAIHTTR
jgi:hypothetical protein